MESNSVSLNYLQPLQQQQDHKFTGSNDYQQAQDAIMHGDGAPLTMLPMLYSQLQISPPHSNITKSGVINIQFNNDIKVDNHAGSGDSASIMWNAICNGNYDQNNNIDQNNNVDENNNIDQNNTNVIARYNHNNNNDNNHIIMNTSNNDNNNVVSLVVFNGRKVMGPPENWEGPPPSSSCELYIRRVPKDLNEYKLIEPFARFGRIYEIRLPLDYQQANRGYAYIKYSAEFEAAAALEVMQHYFIRPGLKFDITPSYEKCRLFITNLPITLSEQEIEQKIAKIFPNMQYMYFKEPTPTKASGGLSNAFWSKTSFVESVEGARNTGNVVVHFPNHIMALEAKKNISPGVIRLWGRDLKVIWASTEREADLSNSNKTLFVRNVDLTVNPRETMDFLARYVDRSQILKVVRVRHSAFIDFTTRDAAETAMQAMQGVTLKDKKLEFEWAKPSEHASLHRLRDTDFDAVLRLKCIANNWMIPVVIFGTYYTLENIQYGAVIMRNYEGIARAIYCILHPIELSDIHSRLCEVVCVLIETIGTFPDSNYVFSVQQDTAHLLGMVIHSVNAGVIFTAAHKVPADFVIDMTELTDLSCAVAVITSTSEEQLLAAYCESFRCSSVNTYLQGYSFGLRCLGTIIPGYRNTPPLANNLNDAKIVLALCYAATGSNCQLPNHPHLNMTAAIFDSGCADFTYMSMKLLPIALTQSRYGKKYVHNQVHFGGGHHYYHPDLRHMTPPVWISLNSYGNSMKHHSASPVVEQCDQPSPTALSDELADPNMLQYAAPNYWQQQTLPQIAYIAQ